jgi:ferredoxin
MLTDCTTRLQSPNWLKSVFPRPVQSLLAFPYKMGLYVTLGGVLGRRPESSCNRSSCNKCLRCHSERPNGSEVEALRRRQSRGPGKSEFRLSGVFEPPAKILSEPGSPATAAFAVAGVGKRRTSASHGNRLAPRRRVFFMKSARWNSEPLARTMPSLRVQCRICPLNAQNETFRHLPGRFTSERRSRFQQNTFTEYLLGMLCCGMLKTVPDTQVVGACQFVFITHFSDFAHRRIVSWNTKLTQSQKFINKGVVT